MWKNVKDIVLKSDSETLRVIHRQLKMHDNKAKDFRVKMRLIERHPSIIYRELDRRQQ